EILRVCAARQGTRDLVAGEVEHLDMVAVAGADVEGLRILGEQDAARALTDRDRLDGFENLAIHDRDRVVLLVRDVDRVRRRDPGRATERDRYTRDQPIRHLVSGLSIPSVSSSENWCRKPGCGDTETRERASASRMGWRSCPSQDRKLRRTPLYPASSRRSSRKKPAMTAGSVDFDCAAASPIARVAIQPV